MAVGTMIAEDLVTSGLGALFGIIKQATLYLRQPNEKFAGPNMSIDAIKNTAASIQNNVLSDSISKGWKETQKYISIIKENGFIPVSVQYNPKSIRFRSYNGRITSGGVGTDQGMGSQTQIQMKATTHMSFQLVFTDIELKDAFMWEKFRLSIRDVASAVSEVSRVATGKRHTVKNEVEGLIGMMCRPETRRILFSWGDMAYQGEVTNLDANYTMFSPDGNPIMATVDVTVQQIADDSSTRKADEDYWNASFDRLFKNGKTDVQGQTVMQSVSSILNINV